jgi:hypothetical protein
MSIKYNSIIPTGSGGSGTWNGGTVTNEIIADGGITTTDLTVTGTLNADLGKISTTGVIAIDGQLGSLSLTDSARINLFWSSNQHPEDFARLGIDELILQSTSQTGTPHKSYIAVKTYDGVYGEEYPDNDFQRNTFHLKPTFLKLVNIQNEYVELSTDGLRFADGTVQTTAGGGSGLPLTGGIMSGAIRFDEVGIQNIAKGSFDSGRGGYNGISLTCAVDYELNWQAGYLKALNSGGLVVPINVESSIALSNHTNVSADNLNISITGYDDVENKTWTTTHNYNSLSGVDDDNNNFHLHKESVGGSNNGGANWWVLGVGGANGHDDAGKGWSINHDGASGNNNDGTHTNWNINANSVSGTSGDDPAITWSLGVNGATFPDGSVQTTAYTGNTGSDYIPTVQGVTLSTDYGLVLDSGDQKIIINPYGPEGIMVQNTTGDQRATIFHSNINLVSGGVNNGNWDYSTDINAGYVYIRNNGGTGIELDPETGLNITGGTPFRWYDAPNNADLQFGDGLSYTERVNTPQYPWNINATPNSFNVGKNGMGYVSVGGVNSNTQVGIIFSDNSVQVTAYSPTTQNASIPYTLYDKEVVVTINGVTYAMLARIVT